MNLFPDTANFIHQKIKTKKFLLIVFFFIIIVPSSVFLLSQNQKNSLTILASQNKFHVEFAIPKANQKEFTEFLKAQNIPQSVKLGLDFETDSTTSARLAFFTPIKTNFKILGNKIIFSGTTNSQNKELPRQNFKIPKETSLAVFAPNFGDFLKSKFTLPDDFSTWLSENLTSESGQYLIVFGKNADFALAWQNSALDLNSLKTITTNLETEYKEQEEEGINLHLVRLTPKDKKEQTFAIFKIGQWFFITSSLDTARTIIAVQQSQTSQIHFESNKKGQKEAFALFLTNDESNSLNDSFFDLLSIDNQLLMDMLLKITRFEFTLKENDFSGLIILK